MADLEPRRLERVWEGLGRDVVTMKHEGFLVDFRRLEVQASAATVYGRLTQHGRRRWLAVRELAVAPAWLAGSRLVTT